MSSDKKRVWYALPEGKDPSKFENWELVEEDVAKRQLVDVPKRSCIECLEEINIVDYMKVKDLCFLDALFTFKHAMMLVCPKCQKEINAGTFKPKR